VVLLSCDRAMRERLRASGLHGGDAVDERDGVEPWLKAHATPPIDPRRLAPLLARWLEWIRNEAAMSDAVCTVWMPRMPPEIAELVRRAAGNDLIEISGDDAQAIHARLCAGAMAPPDTEDKIFAIVSIRNGGLELLPHWLEHYTRLGVDEILLGVFDDIAGEAAAEIDRCAARWTFRRFTQHWTSASEIEQYSQREAACRRAGARPQTWILHTDLDELHEYPAPIHDITAAAAEKGISALHGHFVDRVAADGSLPAVRPHPSLWEQFPVCCNLTAGLLRGGTQKVMLSRFRVHISTGHHIATHQPVLPPPIGTAGDYQVAHFKWHGDVPARMRWSLAQPNTSPTWKREAKRFLAWLDAHNGRIDLSDPALQARNSAEHA
jgi:hypothetical protein